VLIVDSSAIVAMMFGEPEADSLATRMGDASARLLSAANYVETGTVLAGRVAENNRDNALADLDAFLTAFDIKMVEVTPEQAITAVRARIRYGKGFGTAAGLNYGDTFAYALAKAHNAPLLFIRDDFTKTDVGIA